MYILQIQKISKIGGENVAKTVRNILLECIGHELAQIYTWTGQKKKPALKDCEISRAIVGVYKFKWKLFNHSVCACACLCVYNVQICHLQCYLFVICFYRNGYEKDWHYYNL